MKPINFYILSLLCFISFSCTKLRNENEKLEGVYVNSRTILEVLELQGDGRFRLWANSPSDLVIIWEGEMKKPFEVGKYKIIDDNLNLSFENNKYKNYKIIKFRNNFLLKSTDSISDNNVFLYIDENNFLIKHPDKKLSPKLQHFLSDMVVNDLPIFKSINRTIILSKPKYSDYLGFYKPTWFKAYFKKSNTTECRLPN